MNYLKTYINLCRTRSSNSKSQDVYRESHHVFPVSVFGKNEFLVNLTPREHYIAHWLLYRLCMKRYGKNHISGYRFCRNHNETYGVKPATIGNIIYSSDDE